MRVVEFTGSGPGPFCGMMLSDFGAQVIRIDRRSEALEADRPPALDALLGRGRRSIAVDLKHPEATELVLELIASADALIEGFRPGVMERLGLGPDVCLARNPRLVYGRVTGWGREGPYADMAGHDLNFIALAGALEPMGRPEDPPPPPLNLIGDFGGGGMLLALGMLAATIEASRSGTGQVVDAAMLDGSALLMTMFHGLRAAGAWVDARGSNFNDSGSHYYQAYETADHQYLSIAAIEPRFYAELIDRLGLAGQELPAQDAREAWPAMKERFAEIFRAKTLAEWSEALEGTDVCFAPVLPFYEAARHPHNVARGTFTEVEGVLQPAPAPRFGRTAAGIQGPPPRIGEHTNEILTEIGVAPDAAARLRETGVVA
jgi:alpha-methylacyl-CoA racemase